MINTTILLGGGASAAEGAPVQNLLFKKYFKALREKKNYSDRKRVSELCDYFKQMFFIDVLQDDLDAIEFPTFEEAIGLLDLAVRKRQSFKEFDLENIAKSSNRIGFIRQYLVLLMAEVLEDRTAAVKGLHRVLVDRLSELGCLADTVFLSTNYDVLIDQALIGRNDIAVDYGIDFSNYQSPACSAHQHKPVINLYKVHGSLNWSYCPTCNTLKLLNCQQGLLRLHTEPSQALCANCQSIKMPVIVPPTFFKNMSNNFINIVWHKTETCLRDVSHIIFCGYSFPDADMHIKYLLKRIQTNRPDRLRITVINNYPGKKQEKIDEEQKRYTRFLGTGIRYTDNTFEDFCRQPENFL
ncbi:SIR2 family protein [Sporomusa termitida]|uniref:SIR2-like domain protein n=1 Tax=Sporomusa termitida TaxID=2377 RepID=A0A517DUU1_9FIRM|nr:SIR2 family protein [Sporomusa termitida]QDR81124.1 SIR2-like domain protein [Sporomusa termitida]